MMTWLLGLLGLGGGIAALVFVPGLLGRALVLLKGLLGLITAYPWQTACAVLLGVTVWCWQGWSRVAAWQSQVTAETARAAHLPRLAHKDVVRQVRALGTALDQVEAAQIKATAEATVAKQAEDRRNEQNRKDRNDALPTQIADNRRRAQPWIDANRVRGPAAALDRGDHGATDLPGPRAPAAQPDRSDSRSDLVAVPIQFIDACAVVTARLQNAADWAAGLGQPVAAVTSASAAPAPD